MRIRVPIAALFLVASVTGGWMAQRSPAAAQSGVVPCTDPRGCPDLTVKESALTHSVLKKTTFAPTHCAVVEGMTKAGTRELLEFAYATPNLGPGALKVGSVTAHPDLFEFSDCHGHYHFRQYADYRLWTPQGYNQFQAFRAAAPNATAAEILNAHPELRSQLVEGAKRGFCVIDFKVWAGFQGTRDPRTYVDCTNNQGIGVGWVDKYSKSLDGQWIDVTDVPNGNYVLNVEANAERVFAEANYKNNSASFPVVVKHQ